jgi:hypothetical protein
MILLISGTDFIYESTANNSQNSGYYYANPGIPMGRDSVARWLFFRCK